MINSVIKAIRILRLFNTNHPTLTLTEISKRLGLPKSTAYNLLNTLLSEGFIEKVDGDAYALGTAIMPLTQNVRVNIEMRDRAAPLVRSLAETCRESVYLTIRENDQVLYIYAIESSHRLLARSAVGDHAPLYCTAVGKAILSMLPDEEIAAIIDRTQLQRFTEHTLTTPEMLIADLEQARKRGFAIDNQEHELNTYCIGSAIRNAGGHIIGACSVSGGDPEVIGSRIDELSGQLMQTTQNISRLMGYVPARLNNLNHWTKS